MTFSNSTGNLLVTKDCRLRIADFGLARERPTGHGKDPDEEIDGKRLYNVIHHYSTGVLLVHSVVNLVHIKSLVNVCADTFVGSPS
jgi:serine/threonine protein kinase